MIKIRDKIKKSDKDSIKLNEVLINLIFKKGNRGRDGRKKKKANNRKGMNSQSQGKKFNGQAGEGVIQ